MVNEFPFGTSQPGKRDYRWSLLGSSNKLATFLTFWWPHALKATLPRKLPVVVMKEIMSWLERFISQNVSYLQLRFKKNKYYFLQCYKIPVLESDGNKGFVAVLSFTSPIVAEQNRGKFKFLFAKKHPWSRVKC